MAMLKTLFWNIATHGDLGSGDAEPPRQFDYRDALIRSGRGDVEIVGLGARDRGLVGEHPACHRRAGG
jgi:hypothetical protein